MRTSLRLAAAAVFLLLVLTTAMEAEAIRLDAESRAAVVSQQQTVVVNRSSDNLVKNKKDASGNSLLDETKRSGVVSAKDVRATAHRLPKFHEDYYGANVHEPRHH